MAVIMGFYRSRRLSKRALLGGALKKFHENGIEKDFPPPQVEE